MPSNMCIVLAMISARFCPAFFALLLMSGCYSASRMDRLVYEEIASEAGQDTGISSNVVDGASASARERPRASDDVLVLDRQRALILATQYSRELQTKRDTLYRAGLSLFGSRRNFGLQVNGTIEYVIEGPDASEQTEQAKAIANIEQLLPSGGRFSASGTASTGINAEDGSPDNSSAEIRIDQPLLSGAGYTASHEELIQAERDFIYALRTFTLERQDFAIETLRGYYDLLRQRKALENAGTNYYQFVFLRQRSEALFKVNRAPAIDVLRSQQEELSALNRLTSAEELYRVGMGRFLISLGLSPDATADVADDVPAVRDIGMDETNAVALALRRRLDVQTTRDQRDDARRRVDVARNAYRPDVSAFGQATWSNGESVLFTNSASGESWQAGVRAEIPFDRRDERDAVRVAELALAAAERSLDEKIETVTLDVREAFSRIRSLRVSVDVEQKNIDIAQKRSKNALLEFRNGRLSNRDVVEAANGLLAAQNAYISALTDFDIQRLTLLRQIGLLDVARDGSLIELTPDA